MSATSLKLRIRSAVIGITLITGSCFAEPGPPSPSILDDAAMFRQHAKLKADLDTEAKALNNETGVITLLKTVAFITGDTTASHARQLAEAGGQSIDQPVAAILYVRGNRSAGIGTNTAFDAIVPAFELASLPYQGADENTDPARQIADTYRRLHLLVRRYTNNAPKTDAIDSLNATRIAERWLLAAILAISAIIIAACAWLSRRKTSSN